MIFSGLTYHQLDTLARNSYFVLFDIDDLERVADLPVTHTYSICDGERLHFVASPEPLFNRLSSKGIFCLSFDCDLLRSHFIRDNMNRGDFTDRTVLLSTYRKLLAQGLDATPPSEYQVEVRADHFNEDTGELFPNLTDALTSEPKLRIECGRVYAVCESAEDAALLTIMLS